MQCGSVICDYCGKKITFPGIFNLTATFKTRVGITKPMGYAEFEGKNLDFCDVGHLEMWIEDKHKRESNCARVDIWDRGE